MGCICHPLEDFAHDGHDHPIPEYEFPLIKCEMFEPRRNRQESAKNIYKQQYRTQRAIYANKKVKHLDISEVPCRKTRCPESGGYKIRQSCYT
jgi:hypothetical protein